MTTTRHLLAAVSIALSATVAFAQQAAQPAAPASEAKMNMHDHGAERNSPMPKSHMAKKTSEVASAAASGAASGTAARAKVKPHDHSKEKNN